MYQNKRELSFVFCLILFASAAVTVAACGGNGSDPDGGGDASACAGAQTRCNGATFETCSDGSFVPAEQCADECNDTLGCVVCQPATATCDGDLSSICLMDGSGFQEQVCDAVQGMSCNESTGLCEGACSTQELGVSYIGCDYYPTITANGVGTTFEFAVAIANTSTEDAEVTMDEGPLAAPLTFTVPPGEVHVQTLPWSLELKLCSSTTFCDDAQARGALVAGGAFHLRSTQPVTVYQFNPLDYTDGTVFSFSNDASLLLPTNAWGQTYVAAAWQRSDVFSGSNPTMPSFVAITAMADSTQVTLTTTADTDADQGAPAFAAGAARTLTLNRGDVLEVASFGTFGDTPREDLTGSLVSADKPVQVISGHYCGFIPDEPTSGACDHLEESMFPIATLSNHYLVTSPAVGLLPNGKEQVVRIIATEPDTALTFDPPLGGTPTTIARAGEFVEIAREAGDFLVTADNKILVVQYMEGRLAGGNEGDPAMALSVATEQYRDQYLFHAPTSYLVNYANITAPMGSEIALDGAPITDFTPIGDSGFGVAKVQLGPGNGGNHTATGPMDFGLSIYGYGDFTSYWYPGGLDLDVIVVD